MTVSKNKAERENSQASEVSEFRSLSKNSNLEKPDLKGDWWNLTFLFLIYVMQIMPHGLGMAIPILLQSNKNVTYSDQALFSISLWPFSTKILWAPIVDTLYVKIVGKRKSWLIPIQYLIGVCFLYIAKYIDEWLPETEKPNVMKLLYIFFITEVLGATQDIVIDGWGLTILKKKNIGYVSMCQSTGQMVGLVISSVLPVLITSETFCNKYLRFTPATGGMLTIKSLFCVWGILFILITTLIALFKREKDVSLDDDNHVKLGIFQNYSLLWDIMKLPSIRILAVSLLTVKIGFAAVDNVSILKLIDAGISKENIMLIRTAMYGVKIIMPLVVAKYTSGPKPLNIYLMTVPARLFWNIIIVILVYSTPTLIEYDGVINIPLYYYLILIFILAINDMLHYTTGVAATAFYSRISDYRFGGTYMTLFYTLTNLGGAWTSSVSIETIDLFTFKECSNELDNNCSTLSLQKMCTTNGGDCIVLMNGFYIEAVLCTVVGIIWYRYFSVIFKKIQEKDSSYWLVNVKKTADKNDKDQFITINEL